MKFVLNVPFQLRDVASYHGAKWDNRHRVHIWEGESLPPRLKAFHGNLWSWNNHVERELNGLPVPEVPGRRELTPRPDQLQGMEWIKQAYKNDAPGFLLADDVGLGKTLVAWEAMKQMLPPGSTVGIICPFAVIGNWTNMLAERGNGGLEPIILNYDRLRVFFDVQNQPAKRGKKRKKGKTLKGVARYGDVDGPDALIIDEGQYLRNPQAARSKLMFRLYENAEFMIWMSASPGQNPLELAYLLPLLRYCTDGTKKGACTAEALETWASRNQVGIRRGNFGRWEWEAGDGENKKVSRILYQEPKIKIACRRTPQEIAGWPELQRIIDPIELNEEQRSQYNQHWETLRAAVLATKAEARHQAKSPAMVELMRFRQKASLIRIDQTADKAEELIQSGYQVAISCQFLDTIQGLQNALQKRKIKTVKVTGESRDAQLRHDLMTQFNNGEYQVCLFTVCEGINLQEGATRKNDKPRAQIDHDIRWSGIQMYQIDGRCHRNGKFAKVYWTYATDTAEITVIERVLARLKGIHTLSGDDETLIRELEDAFLNAAK